MNDMDDRQISPFVRELLADASIETLQEAQRDYEEYLSILLRIYRRLESEGYFSSRRDKTNDCDSVNGEEQQKI